MVRTWLAALCFALGCSAAGAQAVTDAWIVERILAGRFDELRKVEAESNAGAPAAMYWWGRFLEGCVFGRCDASEARSLWMKAALAGHPDARVAAMMSVQSREELDELIGRMGKPATFDEKMGHVTALLRLAVPRGPGPDSWMDARAVTRELVETDPRLAALYRESTFDGPMKNREAMRAMAEAGYPPAAEQFRRLLLISQRADYPKQLAMARDGDVAVGVAMCQTVNITEGFQGLPAELLRICEEALAKGYLAVVPALLRHHRGRGDAKAAAFYADLCVQLAACASDLAGYHYRTSGKSAAWRLWDAVAAMGIGARPEEVNLPPEEMQQVFVIRMRHFLAERACGARRYDAAAKKFEDAAGCPHRGPAISIPSEFVGARS